MQNRYFQHVVNAKENYSEQKPRPGYPKGLLTWFRHQPKKNKSVVELELKLKDADEEQAKELIEKSFKCNKFNNHSFNAYLFDELVSFFPKEGWHQYNPKPIIFYQGILYRGTSFSPTTIFEKGFLDYNPSKSLDAYSADCNGSIGISTSKCYRVAAGYALPVIKTKDFDSLARELHNIGYVYEINYRGHVGIDIEETQLQRNNFFSASLARNKREVNVLDRIQSCDIIRAWKLTRDKDERVLIENKLYKSERKTDEKDFAPRLIVSSRDYLPTKQEEQELKTLKI